MKLNSRSTLGVFIGSVQIIGFVVISVYIIYVLTKLSDLSSTNGDVRNDDIDHWYSVLLYILLVTCLIVAFTSVLLIIGIIERRSILMKPWIYVNIFGIGINIIRIIVILVSGFSGDTTFESVFSSLLFGLLGLGLQLLIFRSIYNLCKKIQEESQQ